jgi:predicted transcriptional regulator
MRHDTNIRLKPDIEAWLEAQVAEGRFPSIEAAIEALVDEERIAYAALENADLGWAAPYVAKGLADIDAGRTHSAEQVHAELRVRFPCTREP